MADPLEEILAKTQPTLEDIAGEEEDKRGLLTRGADYANRLDKIINPMNILGRSPPGRAGKAMTQPMLEGFNTQLANTMGLPVELVNEALNHAAGAGFLERPGNAMEHVRKSFRLFGVNTYEGPAAGFLEKVGEEMFRQVLFFGALRAAAPSLTSGHTVKAKINPEAPGVEAVAGPGPTIPVRIQSQTPQTGLAAVGDTMGKAALEKPMTTLTAQVGSSPGIVAGGPIGEAGAGIVAPLVTDDPTAQKVIAETGKMAGEVIGGGLTSIPAVGAAKRVRIIPRSETPKLQPYADAIGDRMANPDYARTVADESVKRNIMALDKKIIDTIEGVGPERLRPKDASTVLVARLRDVLKSARNIENEAHALVPKDAVIDQRLDEVIDLMMTMKNSSSLERSTIPHQFIKDFEDAVVKRPLGEDGAIEVVPPTMAQLSKFLTSLRDARWAEQGGTITGPRINTGLRDNMRDLEDAIFNAIDASLPDSRLWARARAITRDLNDRFTRGPIGSVLGLDRQATARVHPEEAMDFLLSRRGGVDAITKTQGRLPDDPEGKHLFFPKEQHMQLTPGVIHPERPKGGPELNTAADMAIRSKFVEQAELEMSRSLGDDAARAQAGAQAGSNFATRLKQDVDSYTATTSRIFRAVEEMKTALHSRKDWENSATAQFAKDTPDVAIRRVFAAVHPDFEVRRIMMDMRGKDGKVDVDALAGLGKQMIDNLINTSKSPDIAAGRLASPQLRPAFESVLGAERTERLQTILEGAIQIDQANRAAGTGVTRRAADVAALVIGNWTGHGLAFFSPSGGYGKLAWPARMTKMMQALVSNAFGGDDPAAMISGAVYNRELEALLRSNIPTNIQEAEKFAQAIRHIATLQNMYYDRAVSGHMEKYKTRGLSAEEKIAPSLNFQVP